MLTFPASNPKILKSKGEKVYTGILHLSPATLSGRNVCQTAVNQNLDCVKYCLNLAGRGGIIKHGEKTNKIQVCRIRRTNEFFDDRGKFFAELIKDIKKIQRDAAAADMIAAVRLNGTSDLPWEKIRDPKSGRTMMEFFPDVQFYDYTKDISRAIDYIQGIMPKNYFLTYSVHEKTDYKILDWLLSQGGTAAIIGHSAWIPVTYFPVSHHREYPVINADLSDARFLDPKGTFGYLRAKGPARKVKSYSIME
jgi:hypothetical protein